MTKTFITVLLFLLALTLLGFNKNDLYGYMGDHPYDLIQGVKLYTPAVQLNDFKDQRFPIRPNTGNLAYYGDARLPYLYIYDTWYKHDFAEEPFDGRLQVLVMGEPLPSANATIFIVLAVAGIIMWSRNKLQRTAA